MGVVLFFERIDYNKKCDCFISLNKINKNNIRNVQFFDLESKQYRGEGDLIDEIKSFFSRFGIRFEKIWANNYYYIIYTFNKKNKD